MQVQDTGQKRAHGDGSLYTRPNAKGGQTWLGKWRINGRGVTRTVGQARCAVHPTGLTRPQAEAKFRQMREAAQVKPERAASGHTLREVGDSLLEQMKLDGRRPATLEGMDSALRIHVVPFFGLMSVAKTTQEDVHNFHRALAKKGLSPKSRRNLLINLHSLFKHAIQRGWRTVENPVKDVKKPVSVQAEGTIRFLAVAEVEALLQAVPADTLGSVEKPMYLTAAMTGLRQGELFALRWRDVDWTGRTIHVRENFVRGQFQSPKSKKVRSVPMSKRVATELEGHYARTPFTADMDLVFAHPQTGNPIDRSKVSKRFKLAVKRAGVGGFEPVMNARTGKQQIDSDGQPVTRPLIRFHDLRHTFATNMARNENTTMQDVQTWMGHADLETTLIYAHYVPNARGADLVDAAFSLNVPQDAPVLPSPSPDDPLERISKLAALHAAGALTADEFAAAKAPLLAAISA